MDFDWNASNTGHIAIHGITPAEAEAAIYDPRPVAGEWYLRNDEWRLNIMGRAGDRVLFVVITTRDQLIRVVTARVADPAERRRYWSEQP
jgi:uncharacterized DUF497 family protein